MNETATEAATLKVNGALMSVDEVKLDFGRDESNPLPKTLDVKIGDFAEAQKSIPLLTGINTGLTTSIVRGRIVNGTELLAVALPMGFHIILR